MSLLLLLAPETSVADRYFAIVLGVAYQPVSPRFATGAALTRQQLSTLILDNGRSSVTLTKAPT